MEVFEKVVNYQYDFEDDVWYKTSNEAKDLISRLLSPPDTRLTTKEALNHPWIRYFTN